jgi:UDP-glucose 4-epimerase
MNILITGGAGYIGSVTVNKLIQNKHNVIIYDDLSCGHKQLIHPHAKFIKGDILDVDKLDDIFKNNPIDIVFHFAAKIVVSESVKLPKLYRDVNTIGTQNILDVMTKYHCNKLIFTSTAAVYGNPKNIPIDENDNKEPINPYGQSKLDAEDLIIKRRNMKYVIFRFFNVAGADNEFGEMNKHPTHLIPCISKLLIENKTPIIYGNQYKTRDGTCLRDYIHVIDIASACIDGVEYLKNNKVGIFNLGSNSGNTVLEVVREACKVNNISFKYQVEKPRSGDPDELIASNQFVKQELG